jgi:hypothetical protein
MAQLENLLRDLGCHEALLQSEIGFWRELIETCREDEPAETVERMQQALALAERRLAKLSEYRPTDTPVAPALARNVYRLNHKRRGG